MSSSVCSSLFSGSKVSPAAEPWSIVSIVERQNVLPSGPLPVLTVPRSWKPAVRLSPPM